MLCPCPSLGNRLVGNRPELLRALENNKLEAKSPSAPRVMDFAFRLCQQEGIQTEPGAASVGLEVAPL